MKCAEFMTTDPPRLTPSATVAAALGELIAAKLAALPIVDGDGRYLGMFSARELLSHILPQAMKLGSLAGDLGYMHQTLANAGDDLRRIAADAVMAHIEADYPVLSPETELMRALQLLYAGRDMLPVVEPAGSRYIGLVTRLDALAVLMGRSHGG